MRAVTKIQFTDDDGNKFFGEGPLRLLRCVEKTGSLRAAAIEMEMAYSKANKLLKQAEANRWEPDAVYPMCNQHIEWTYAKPTI